MKRRDSYILRRDPPDAMDRCWRHPLRTDERVDDAVLSLKSSLPIPQFTTHLQGVRGTAPTTGISFDRSFATENVGKTP